MIKLYDSNITDILPEKLSKNANVIALGYAIKIAMQRLIEYCRSTSVYAVIDSAPENVLDLLALDLDTQYYNDSLDIGTKRNLVKNALIWHATAGTPSAVDELVAVVFGTGKVSEWFEYGDEPYYFKIATDASLTEELSGRLELMISRAKNTRSHLRGIEIARKAENTVRLVPVLGHSARQRMDNDFSFGEEKYLNIRVMVAAAGEIYEDCEGNPGRNIETDLVDNTRWIATSLGHNSHCFLHEGWNRGHSLITEPLAASGPVINSYCELSLSSI